MNRRNFERKVGEIYEFRAECEKTAKEIIRKKGGRIELDSLGGEYYFISLGCNAKFKSAFITEQYELLVEAEIKATVPVTSRIPFDEATWDMVMLSDFMHAIFDADGKEDSPMQRNGFEFENDSDNSVCVYDIDDAGSRHYAGNIYNSSVDDITDMTDDELEEILAQNGILY